MSRKALSSRFSEEQLLAASSQALGRANEGCGFWLPALGFRLSAFAFARETPMLPRAGNFRGAPVV